MAAVKRSGADPTVLDARRGLGSEDNPTFEGMHEAAAHVVGATVEAARRVWTGEVDHAANIAGGLHHAMPGRASGFCIYNDVAVAIRWLLDNGAERVAYVDVDVHHGDGVEKIFYDDPRVLTDQPARDRPDALPGHRLPRRDRRAARPRGRRPTSRCRPGTADAGWLRAFHAVVPPLVREFAPDVLVTQHGCDSHIEDPLAHLLLSVDGQRSSYLALHDLAHEVCGGKWLATGGGGYSLVDVVPRAWTPPAVDRRPARPLDPGQPVPEDWREHGPRPSAAYGAAPDDRRPHPRLARLARRLRPRRLARPGHPRDADGGLPAARAGPDALIRGIVRCMSSRHAT